MGHYYSEMMCQRCGSIHCVCPHLPSTDHLRWINDHDDQYSAITIADFDKKYAVVTTRFGTTPGIPHILRLRSEVFDSKEKAEAHSIVLLKNELDGLERRMKLDAARMEELRARINKEQ